MEDSHRRAQVPTQYTSCEGMMMLSPHRHLFTSDRCISTHNYIAIYYYTPLFGLHRRRLSIAAINNTTQQRSCKSIKDLLQQEDTQPHQNKNGEWGSIKVVMPKSKVLFCKTQNEWFSRRRILTTPQHTNQQKFFRLISIACHWKVGVATCSFIYNQNTIYSQH